MLQGGIDCHESSDDDDDYHYLLESSSKWIEKCPAATTLFAGLTERVTSRMVPHTEGAVLLSILLPKKHDGYHHHYYIYHYYVDSYAPATIIVTLTTYFQRRQNPWYKAQSVARQQVVSFLHHHRQLVQIWWCPMKLKPSVSHKPSQIPRQIAVCHVYLSLPDLPALDSSVEASQRDEDYAY